MKKWLLLTAFFLTAGSAQPVLAVVGAPSQFYVSLRGYDGNAGTSALTAFGSLTQAVQALTAVAVPQNYTVIIAPGEYHTSKVSLNGMTVPQAIEFYGDTGGAYFSVLPGPVNVIADATQEATASVQNMPPVKFTNLAFHKQGIAGQHIVHIDSGKVTLTSCMIGESTNSLYGIYAAGPAYNLTVDGCVVSGTAYGIYLSRTGHSRIQNCWLKENNLGLTLEDAQSGVIVNNLIASNAKFGLTLINRCQGTVVFNNVLVNNGDQLGTGGGQVKFDYSPLADVSGPLAIPSWRSGYNLIGGQGHRFAEFNLSIIYNQKQWQEQTGQDLWGTSLDNYLSLITFPPTDLNNIGGYGVMTFNGQAAPATDLLGRTRPQAKPDFGCVEQDESTWSPYLHHVELTPSSAQALPLQSINVAAKLCNAQGNLITPSPSELFYVYLQSGPLPTQVDPQGQIAWLSGLGNFNSVTTVAGLYSLNGVSSSFQIKVSRNDGANNGTAFPVRVVHWGDWASTTAMTYGGQADNGATRLRWSTQPDALRSTAAATSPVAASGLDFSQITLRIVDAAGNPVIHISPADFNFSAGGNYTLNPVTEDSTQPGTYYLGLSSTEVGVKTLQIKALGVLLSAQPQISFVPGVYGTISDQGSGQSLSGIRVTLYAPDGTVAAACDAVNGAYSLAVPEPAAAPYSLVAEDPSGIYPRAAFSLTIPAGGVVQQNIQLASAAPAKLLGYAYPNPAPRGANITLAYALPRPGRLRLDLYDLRGRRIGTLVDNDLPAGRSQTVWRAANRFGQNLAPGVYVLAFTLNSEKTTAKLVITP